MMASFSFPWSVGVDIDTFDPLIRGCKAEQDGQNERRWGPLNKASHVALTHVHYMDTNPQCEVKQLMWERMLDPNLSNLH